MLCSGLGGLGAYWQPQLAALGERTRVITYDQRGTGLNAGELPHPYTIAAMADDVADILDGGRCHFVGHALGALVGLEIALRHPDSLASLVLVNGWSRMDPHTRRCFAVRTGILRDSGPAAYIQAQPIFLHPAAYLSRHADRLAREEAQALAHFQGTETLLRRIGALSAFDVTQRLSLIRARTLVIANRDDMLVPWTSSQAMAAAMPSATLAIFETGGHAGNVTDPAPFNATVVEFLLS